MEAVSLFARAALVTVFAVAATGKLRARSELTASLPQFGLPARRSVASAIIAGELVTAALLAVTPLAGCVASAALLLGFTAGLRRILASGVRASCRCFGRRSTPVAKHHVVRNLALVGLAAAGGLTAVTDAATDAATETVLAGFAIALGAAVGLAFTRWDDLAAVVRFPAQAGGR